MTDMAMCAINSMHRDRTGLHALRGVEMAYERTGQVTKRVKCKVG